MQLASLNFIFYAEKTSQTFNELTIQYKCGNKTVLGIIDRLIVNDSEALIIDYKSHQSANNENIHSLLAQYSPQMQLYADGIKQIYPNKKIKAALLFTHIAQLHYLEF